MPWLFWQLNSKAGTRPPIEWLRLAVALLGVLPRKYVEKIELIAFSIKGKRTARWLIDRNDPEYCTKSEALAVAKKLAWLTLMSGDPPLIESRLRTILSCDETQGCKLFIGHEGNCRTTGNRFSEATRCQLCGRRLVLEDFDRNGRRDPNSIQVGHRTPLSRTTRGHNARNVSWAHRACNQLQSEQTVDEALQRMKNILELHGYDVRSR